MKTLTLLIGGMLAGAWFVSGAAIAQEKPTETSGQPDAAEQTAEPSEDSMADTLNSQQQLQQTFKLKRTINGEVVDSEERTVTFSRDDPVFETEAAPSVKESVKAAFDGEVLTRTEAFHEADLDFTVADVNQDGAMTADEFVALATSWGDSRVREAKTEDKETARERQYDAFLAELDPEAAIQKNETLARQKFAFMAGASATLARRDYIREYLVDFYSMDADKDMLLRGDELMRFRALNRGEDPDK